MNALLQQAFAEAAKLSDEEQDVLASRLLAELASEDAFDATIARSAGRLTGLAQEALNEHQAGPTRGWDRG